MTDEIKKSGSHAVNVKRQPSLITNLLNNIRHKPDPEKGKKNPPHWRIKIKATK